MNKKKKVILGLIIALVLALSITLVAIAASKTTCRTIYKGLDGKVAKICYIMNVTWNVAQEQVTCNGEGTLYTVIYKSGYSWTGTGRSCSPNYYASRATGAGYGYLRGPFGTSYHYAKCSVEGDQVNKWFCSTQ